MGVEGAHQVRLRGEGVGPSQRARPEGEFGRLVTPGEVEFDQSGEQAVKAAARQAQSAGEFGQRQRFVGIGERIEQARGAFDRRDQARRIGGPGRW